MTDQTPASPDWSDPAAHLRDFTQRLFGETTEQAPMTHDEATERQFIRQLFGRVSDDPADRATAAAERHGLPADWAGVLKGDTAEELDIHAAELAKHRKPSQPRDDAGRFLAGLFGPRRTR